MGLFVAVAGLVHAEPLPARSNSGAVVASSSPDAQAEVWRILESAAKGRDSDVEELGKSIHDLGGSALPIVAGALCGGLVEPQHDTGDEQDSKTLDPGALELQQRVLRAALGHWPVEDQLEALVDQGRSEPFDQKLQALRFIGEVGSASAIPSLFEVLAGVDTLQLRNSRLRAHAIAALALALGDEAEGYEVLGKRLGDARPEVLSLTVSALGKTGSSRAIPVLMDLVGADSELDLVVIQTLGEVAEQATEGPPDGLADLLRSQLFSRDAQVVRAAAVGLSRMNDLESLPMLLPMLEGDDRALASTVRWCLGHMSGKDFRADRASWSEWFAAESSWYLDESPVLYEALQSEDLAQVGGALTQLCAHRLYRHESVVHIGPLLASTNPNQVRAAADALVSLGSRRAVPWLTGALESSLDDDGRVMLTLALDKLQAPQG